MKLHPGWSEVVDADHVDTGDDFAAASPNRVCERVHEHWRVYIPLAGNADAKSHLRADRRLDRAQLVAGDRLVVHMTAARGDLGELVLEHLPVTLADEPGEERIGDDCLVGDPAIRHPVERVETPLVDLGKRRHVLAPLWRSRVPGEAEQKAQQLRIGTERNVDRR